MTATVETVRGPVPVEELGATLSHEHIYIRNHELETEYPDPEWDEEALVAEARSALEKLHAKGIGTVVDLTVLGLGRYLPRIVRVADGLPINIVVATGYYTMRDLPPYFHNRGPGRLVDEPEPLTRMFVKDIREGIGDTGVKAAMIKVVTDAHGLTPDVERVLDAAVQTHQETGTPIATHSNAAHRTGLLQLEYFRERGVDLTRVLVGHCGDSTDLDYLRRIADSGATIGMDRFGATMFLSDSDRIDTVVALCAAGYAERITLSHDASIYSVNSTPSWRAEHTPNWNHHFISDQVLPQLRERGVTEHQIRQMMVVNPARVLAGAS